MTIIRSVEKNSHAARVGLLPGDVLISINGNEINDILDYRFYLADRRITLKLRRDNEEIDVTIRKGEYDDIGLDFDTPLMDKKHSCTNKCVFCFIDQLPPGMRKSLYFKDDDSRLSFLHGNYITLTNLRDEDIDRIIKMHISPLRVSVHTTDPELRVRMMNNRRAGEVLKYIRRVADAGIDIDAQIVLCRGINDGDALDRTMHDLVGYYPALSSVSVVPAGLTKYRENLCPLSLFSPDEAAGVIEQVTRVGDECVKKFGRRMFFCADELYLRAGIPAPDADYYEGFAQIEDGVGLIASLKEEFEWAMEDAELPESSTRHVSLATGAAAYPTISDLAARLMACVPGLRVDVYEIKNHFFGETITVAGLLTATDLSDQLKDKKLGDELIIPAVALRPGDEPVFLDDKTPEWLAGTLGVRVRPAQNGGDELIRAMLGID